MYQSIIFVDIVPTFRLKIEMLKIEIKFRL